MGSDIAVNVSVHHQILPFHRPLLATAYIGASSETSFPVAYPKTKEFVKPTGDNRFPFQSL
jgi:hypothetical protein